MTPTDDARPIGGPVPPECRREVLGYAYADDGPPWVLRPYADTTPPTDSTPDEPTILEGRP